METMKERFGGIAPWTPGEWTAMYPHNGNFAVLTADCQQVIATCGRAFHDASGDLDEAGLENRANSRLIAAAPALYAALEEAGSLLDALAEGDSGIGEDTRVTRVREQIDAALALARGKDGGQ